MIWLSSTCLYHIGVGGEEPVEFGESERRTADPAKDISAVEHVETVFKNGVGFDSQKLIASVQGMVGIR